VRPNTERPITCTNGTNRLVPPGPEALLKAAYEGVEKGIVPEVSIERWDGKTAQRIAQVICDGASFE
jgi:UDP-N-acetylglucosamine 2-epimerase (non-hydrolysing)